MDKTRVLQVLSNRDIARKLGYKLPRVKNPYQEMDKPASIYHFLKYLSAFEMGILTEELIVSLYKNEDQQNIQFLQSTMKAFVEEKKIPDIVFTKSKAYFENILKTFIQLKNITKNEKVYFQKELTLPNVSIVGHPDIATKDHVFEIKTSRMIKSQWRNFLLQAFCYSSLHPEFKYIHMVFPLQNYIWSYDLSQWKKRKEYLKILIEFQPVSYEQKLFFPYLQSKFPIGSHEHKKGTLRKSVETMVQKFGTTTRPFQIMFSQSTKINLEDEDLVKTLDYIEKYNISLYVHSPYILNIAKKMEKDDNYIVKCLHKHLRYTKTFAGKGVVLHVGKKGKLDNMEAMKNSIANLKLALEEATPECPILLETPAGQGTEMFTTIHLFMTFIEKMNDPRLQVCIDTCHVFACGICPLEYLTTVLNNPVWKSYLKLVHYNDSYGEFGSCVDRHAPIGLGKISHEVLYKCAELCSENNIPMVVE